jgi:hypothetical protein
MFTRLFKNLLPIVAVLTLLSCFLGIPTTIFASTTADVTVNATPNFVGISVDIGTYPFGAVSVSTNTSTTTSYFTIANTSSVTTNQAISVTGATWTGGSAWTHSNTGVPGADTVALFANKGGTWGTGDIIVTTTGANNIATSQAANTNYSFGLRLSAPTSFTDGVIKSNTVRITATAE